MPHATNNLLEEAQTITIYHNSKSIMNLQFNIEKPAKQYFLQHLKGGEKLSSSVLDENGFY
jgi:hypothetical protein